MKRTILAAVVAAMPLTFCVPVLEAQAQGATAGSLKDASQMQESGPRVNDGSGATLGPNSKNQATMPMPGLRQQELSELPRGGDLPPTDVRPIGGPRPTRQTR